MHSSVGDGDPALCDCVLQRCTIGGNALLARQLGKSDELKLQECLLEVIGNHALTASPPPQELEAFGPHSATRKPCLLLLGDIVA